MNTAREYEFGIKGTGDDADEIVQVTTVGEADRKFQGSRRKYMVPRRGKGGELCNLMRKELGIPEGVKWFEVRFDSEGPVTVKCEFLPKEDVTPAKEEA